MSFGLSYVEIRSRREGVIRLAGIESINNKAMDASRR
jgi:hypothetical protein